MEPDHRELLIGLMGSTYGEMKKLDDSIIGSSSTLGRRSDKVKQEITNILKNVAPPPDVPALQMVNQQMHQQQAQQPPPQPIYVPAPEIAQQPIQQPEPQPVNDPGQLEFELSDVIQKVYPKKAMTAYLFFSI